MQQHQQQQPLLQTTMMRAKTVVLKKTDVSQR
jgi:hypothetical protein